MRTTAVVSVLSLQCVSSVSVRAHVYTPVCIVYGPRLFQRRGPVHSPSLHRPFHQSLIHIHHHTALFTYHGPAGGDGRRTSPIAGFLLWEYTHLFKPSPHPPQGGSFFFFFTLTQWIKKRGTEGGG